MDRDIDYDNFIVRPSNLSNPKEILIWFGYEGKEVHLIINDANLLEFRYINCKPKEGAKIAAYCVKQTADNMENMTRNLDKLQRLLI